MHKFKGQEMSIKKLCRNENNANHEEDCGGIPLSSIWCLALFSLTGSARGDVRWYPSLALGSLLEATSNPQPVALSFSF